MKYNLLNKLYFLENYDKEHLPSDYVNNYNLSKLCYYIMKNVSRPVVFYNTLEICKY